MRLSFYTLGCFEEISIKADEKIAGKVECVSQITGKLALERHQHIDIGEKYVVGDTRFAKGGRKSINPYYVIKLDDEGVGEKLREELKVQNAVGFIHVSAWQTTEHSEEGCTVGFYLTVRERHFYKLRDALTRGATPKLLSFEMERDSWTDKENSKDGWLGFGWEPDGSGLVIRLGEHKFYSKAVLDVSIQDKHFALEESVFQANKLRREQQALDLEEEIENDDAPRSIAATENQQIIELLKKLSMSSDLSLRYMKYVTYCAVAIAVIALIFHR